MRIAKKLFLCFFMLVFVFGSLVSINAETNDMDNTDSLDTNSDNYGIIEDKLYDFDLDKNEVKGIYTNTTVSSFKANLNEGMNATVFTSINEEELVAEDALISEGMKISINNSEGTYIGYFIVTDMKDINLDNNQIMTRSANNTPHYFYTITIGKAIDVDGVHGAQCFDLFNYFTSYYHNGVRIGGNGAKDIWLNRNTNGVLNYFTPVALSQVKDGDWVVWGASTGDGYGHVGMFRTANGSNAGIFLNQNYNNRKYTTQDSISYNGIIGVLRPKVFNSTPPVVVPKQPTPGAKSGIEDTLFYRSHVASAGWLATVESGQTSGTTRYSAGLQAFNISARKLPGMTINVQTHAIGDSSWKTFNNVKHDTVIGTTGQSKNLNAFKITSNNYAGMKIQYRAHIASTGWTGWQEQNTIVGSASGKQIEAIQIRVVNDSSVTVSLPYRAHVQSTGWQSFVNTTQVAGTVGKSLRMEAIQIDPSGVSGLKITAKTQSQGEGWRTVTVADKNTVIGTTGANKEMYAISLTSNKAGYKLYYSVHIRGDGWTEWVEDGKQLGTANSGKRIEAIKLKYIKV